MLPGFRSRLYRFRNAVVAETASFSAILVWSGWKPFRPRSGSASWKWTTTWAMFWNPMLLVIGMVIGMPCGICRVAN